MLSQLLTTSAVLLVLAGPAFADCRQEIASLDQRLTGTASGAAGETTGAAGTQQNQSGGAMATAGASGGQSNAPATPHQQEVLAGAQQEQQPAQGAAAGSDQQVRASALLNQARELAQTGAEEECMQKVTEVKSMLGAD